jgi:hypothetical protein
MASEKRSCGSRLPTDSTGVRSGIHKHPSRGRQVSDRKDQAVGLRGMAFGKASRSATADAMTRPRPEIFANDDPPAGSVREDRRGIRNGLGSSSVRIAGPGGR